MDFPFSEADKIAKLVPNELNISLQDAIDKEPELARMEREGTENEQKLIRLSKSLENLSTHLGTHAAGVIIMDQDIREVMPVCTGKDNTVQSRCPKSFRGFGEFPRNIHLQIPRLRCPRSEAHLLSPG